MTRNLETEIPAFAAVPEKSDIPLFIFGDHASKFIPPEFNNLGLSGADLMRHIAWDIGTETLIRKLCERFQCGGLIAGVSRLVIDLNRAPNAVGLIPPESDGTVITDNQGLTDAERQARIDQFYMPYHMELGQKLESLSDPFIVSMHSFTDHPLTGDERATDIGLLTRHDEASADSFLKEMKKQRPDFQVEINQPYSAYDLNYTIDEHVAPRNLRHLAIEVKQSHIDTTQKAVMMAELIANAMMPLLVQNAVYK